MNDEIKSHSSRSTVRPYARPFPHGLLRISLSLCDVAAFSICGREGLVGMDLLDFGAFLLPRAGAGATTSAARFGGAS